MTKEGIVRLYENNKNKQLRMMNTTFKTPLSGIIPPLVTPLKNNETLDV